jgi:hypothetical protein
MSFDWLEPVENYHPENTCQTKIALGDFGHGTDFQC